MHGKSFSILSVEMKKRTLLTMFVVLILGLCLTNALTAFAAEPEKSESSGQVFKTEHMWDAKVTIADAILLGVSKHGWRRIVPITGGTFDGAEHTRRGSARG